MPEETSTALGSGSAEEKPCSSTAAAAADSSVDAMEEAKKLIGTGKRHLVMGDIVSAVNVFQEACGILAAKYGDTADECGEAFFLCGKSLLELARMENSVLGNALEGVPEESEEEEQPKNPNIESADNLDEKTRDDLRKQVYDAMAEEEKTGTADLKQESRDVMSDAEVKRENEVKATVEHGGSQEPSSSSVNGEPKGSLIEAEVDGAETDPDSSVQGVHEKSAEKEVVQQEKTGISDEYKEVPEEGNEKFKPEAQQDNVESEGSRFV